MCDCYSGKCERCGAHIPIHLGDYSVGREQVRAYCPDHNGEALRALTPDPGLSREHIVFTERVLAEDCLPDGEMPADWTGRWVIFVVQRPHGVSLN